MSKLKTSVSFISYGLAPCAIAGAEIFNYYLIKSLSDYFDLEVITGCKKFYIDGVKIRHVNPRLFFIKKWGLSKIAIAIQEIFLMFFSKKSDIYILTYTSNAEYLGFYYPFLMKLINRKYIIINHGGGLKPWKFKKSTKKLFLNSSNNIAISKPIQAEYINRTEHDVVFIPPLVPFFQSKLTEKEILIKYNLPSDKNILFSVGSLKSIKNPIVLLNAFISIGREYIEEKKLLLIFAGDGDLKGEMKKVVLEHNFYNYVKILGAIPFTDISNIYKIGNIFIMNSIYEGTPISMLEAMYNKKMILGTNVQGINSIIKNGINGLLYDYNNQNELKDKIVRIIENNFDIGTMTKNAFEYYQNNYSNEIMISKYIKLINSPQK